MTDTNKNLPGRTTLVSFPDPETAAGTLGPAQTRSATRNPRRSSFSALLEAVGFGHVSSSTTAQKEPGSRTVSGSAAKKKGTFVVLPETDETHQPLSVSHHRAPSGSILRTVGGLFSNGATAKVDKGAKLKSSQQHDLTQTSIASSSPSSVLETNAASTNDLLLGSILPPSLSPMRIFSPRPFEEPLYETCGSSSGGSGDSTWKPALALAAAPRAAPINITAQASNDGKPTLADRRHQKLPKLGLNAQHAPLFAPLARNASAQLSTLLPIPSCELQITEVDDLGLLTTSTIQPDQEGLFPAHARFWRPASRRSIDSSRNNSFAMKLIGEAEVTPPSSGRSSPIFQTFAWQDDIDTPAAQVFSLDAVPALRNRPARRVSSLPSSPLPPSNRTEVFKRTTMKDYESDGEVESVE